MANQSVNSGTKQGCNLTNFLRNFIIPTNYRPSPCVRHKGELTTETRNVMLVAVTLIAAVTFQAGVAPPGGVWQDDENGHVPGRAIYSSQSVSFFSFLICNTLAFSSSIYLLLCLTFGYPFFLEVLVATLSMSGTYAAALFSITPYETTPFRLIALSAAMPIIVRRGIYLLCWKFGNGCLLDETTDETTNKDNQA